MEAFVGAAAAANAGVRRGSVASCPRATAVRGRASRRSARCAVRTRMVETTVDRSRAGGEAATDLCEIGLIGLAVMGQNLAMNIAEKGFSIAVYNRTASRTDDAVRRAGRELDPETTTFRGFHELADFVRALRRPRNIIMLVKAGAPVDATISALLPLLEEGDTIIDGGNEWYTNTQRRAEEAAKVGVRYMGMGVSGGEDGARRGPSLMPGGPKDAYDTVAPVLRKVAAQVDDGPCVTYIGPGGSGNYVKMVHNGIEYGDMQLIGEAYDLLSTLGRMSAAQLAEVFEEWNRGELRSFLIEITSKIMTVKDDVAGDGELLVGRVLDQSGSKGTGMWTMEEAVRRAVPAPTIAASLEGRYLSAIKRQRLAASKVLSGPDPEERAAAMGLEGRELAADVRQALYAAKVCSYAQGMNLMRKAAADEGWQLDLGEIARIWKDGCIIRAQFLDRIKLAYRREPELSSLLVDDEFAAELDKYVPALRRVVSIAIAGGIAVPALSSSLAYYDSYRRARLPSSQLVQAQRDYFGAHTYRRLDRDGVYHTRWSSDGVTENA